MPMADFKLVVHKDNLDFNRKLCYNRILSFKISYYTIFLCSCQSNVMKIDVLLLHDDRNIVASS